MLNLDFAQLDGVVCDDVACGGDNSAAFARAFSAIRDAGGGTLTVSRGVWKTGPIEIFSDTTLFLGEGAVISFIPEPDRYVPVFTRWEGLECHAMHPCVFADGQKNVSITGRGTIDGNGSLWWELYREKRARGQMVPELAIEKRLASLNGDYALQTGGGGGRETQFLRPPLIQFRDCAHVSIRDITIVNSPFWTVHPLYCSDVVISGVTITNPHDAPNTDGIDIDSCRFVEIIDATVNVGDDGIVLKSGSGSDGIRVNKATHDVVVRDCRVGDGHGGIVIGSETAAGVHDVIAERCSFIGTDRGIRIKTRRGRGGVVSDLTFRDCVMERNLCPLAINMYYKCGASESDTFLFSQEAKPVTGETPAIRGITVSGILATGSRASAGFVAGLPESPVEHLVIENSTFSTDETSDASSGESDMYYGIPPVRGKGFRLMNATDPVLRNVTVTGPAEPFIYR